MSHTTNTQTSLKDYIRLKRGRLTPSSTEKARLHTWLLSIVCACFLLNHTCNATIQIIPMSTATGSTCDVSPSLLFHFWQHVLFNSDKSSFPIHSTEETGRLVGVSENAGHRITFSILSATTDKVVSRSNVRLAGEPT